MIVILKNHWHCLKYWRTGNHFVRLRSKVFIEVNCWQEQTPNKRHQYHLLFCCRVLMITNITININTLLIFLCILKHFTKLNKVRFKSPWDFCRANWKSWFVRCEVTKRINFTYAFRLFHDMIFEIDAKKHLLSKCNYCCVDWKI